MTIPYYMEIMDVLTTAHMQSLDQKQQLSSVQFPGPMTIVVGSCLLQALDNRDGTNGSKPWKPLKMLIRSGRYGYWLELSHNGYTWIEIICQHV